MFREDIDHVKDLITFYHVFIKLKDMSSSKAFRVMSWNSASHSHSLFPSGV